MRVGEAAQPGPFGAGFDDPEAWDDFEMWEMWDRDGGDDGDVLITSQGSSPHLPQPPNEVSGALALGSFGGDFMGDAWFEPNMLAA